MSIRKAQFANGEFYHIFNRGVDKRVIFTNQRDIQRFFQSMSEFNTIEPIGSIYVHSFALRSEAPKSEKLVEFICFCLNPNHYHFILKQVSDKGIEKFMHKLSTGYTNYFNLKQKRSGVLFQGPFKAIRIDTNEYLLHLSAYVNLNFKVHQLRSEAPKLVSWDEYSGKKKFNFCSKEDILGQFKNKADYKKFAERSLEGILERKELAKEMEDLLLE
jgi:putative transposase